MSMETLSGGTGEFYVADLDDIHRAGTSGAAPGSL